MFLLITGLILFLGAHSSRIFFENLRSDFIANRGGATWKALYSVISLSGFVLIIFGYAQARLDTTHLWFPPSWLAPLTMILTLLAFILLAAAYVPGNRIRTAVGHPMVLGVKVWAFAHLLVNGELASIILFGSFLAWAVASFISGRQRDRRKGAIPVAKVGIGSTVLTVVIGLIAWVIFALWLHIRWIGVNPLIA